MDYEFIKSKTLRNYYKDNDITLPDVVQAFIIKTSGFGDGVRRRYLDNIINKTSDTKLKECLMHEKEYDKARLDIFKESNGSIFKLEYNGEHIQESDKFDDVYKKGCALDGEFIINKVYDSTKPSSDDNLDGRFIREEKDEFGVVHILNRNVEIDYEIDDYIYDYYYNLPHPFKEGDRVVDLDGVEYECTKQPTHDKTNRDLSAYDMMIWCICKIDDTPDHVTAWEIELK